MLGQGKQEPRPPFGDLRDRGRRSGRDLQSSFRGYGSDDAWLHWPIGTVSRRALRWLLCWPTRRAPSPGYVVTDAHRAAESDGRVLERGPGEFKGLTLEPS